MLDWLRYRYRHSLRLKLLLPLLVIGGGAAAAGGAGLYWVLERHTRTELARWSASLTNAVNYAAEASHTPEELERYITALGAEPEIANIVVAAGQPPRVLAATRLAWAGRPLAALPDAGVRQLLETARSDGRQAMRWLSSIAGTSWGSGSRRDSAQPSMLSAICSASSLQRCRHRMRSLVLRLLPLPVVTN